MSDKRTKILLIEDNPGDARLIQEMLAEAELSRFELECADRLSAGIKRLEQGNIDVILLDLDLPDSKGVDTFTKVYAHTQEKPILVLTGLADEAVGVKAVSGGAQDYLVKGQVDGNLISRSILHAIERKRMEQALQQQNEFLNIILESLTHPFYVVDANDYTIKIANSAAKAGDLSAKPMCYALTHKRNKPCGHMEHPCPLEEVKRTKKPVVVEHIHYDEDGNAKNVEVYAYPIFDTEGNVIQMIEYYLDITERKRMEEEIRVMDSAIASSINAIAMADLEGNLTYVNDSFLKMWGYENDNEVLGKQAVQFWQSEDKALEVVKALEEKGGWVGELVAKRKDGSFFDTQASTSIVVDETGKPIRRMASFIDITKHKQAEETLKSSEERLQILFEFAPDAYYLSDLKGNFVDGNKAAEEITGYKRDELIGKSFLKLKLLSPKQIPKASALLAKNMLGQPTGPYEFILNRKDGTQVPVEIRTFPTKIKGKTVVLGIARDITERKRAEETLRQSEEHFRTIFETTHEGIITTDADGRISSVNPAAATILGYKSTEELVGRLASELSLSSEWRGLALKETLVTGYVENIEIPLKKKDGTPVHILATANIYLDDKGNVEGTEALFKDITERKQMERALQEKNEQLDAQNEELQSQAEELMTQQQELIEKTREAEEASQAKSDFLASMSHELRTPLNVIIGFSQVMMDEVPGKINEEQRQCFEDILSSSQHLLNLINEVLDLSKIESGKEELKLKNIVLTEVIASVTRTMMSILTPRKQSLDVEVEKGLPPVHANKAKIEQVLLNLVDNSSKFTPDGGKLKIEAVREGEWCRVSVIDNGIGIKKEEQKWIFEPFRQLDNPLTKEKKGTGLGLTLVTQIVERYGGRIWVESESGKGSQFIFTLPLATAS